MPANYDSGVFESCQGDNDLPMGVYGTSTWSVALFSPVLSSRSPRLRPNRSQGVSPTPSAHPAAASSSCTTYATITAAPVRRERAEKKRMPVEARATPAPVEREL